MSNLTGDNLAVVIAQRHACLTQLNKLCVRQSELVATGEVGALLRLLSVKNQLIAALQSMEQQIAPFHAQDPETRVWSTPSARANCARQAAECQTLLDEIMEIERTCEQKMTERRDQIATQLQTAQSAGAARRAYQAQQHTIPRPVIAELPTAPPTQHLQTEA